MARHFRPALQTFVTFFHEKGVKHLAKFADM